MSKLTPPTHDELHAYLDGVLEPLGAAKVGDWLAEHPEDAERIEHYRRIGDALQVRFDPVLNEPIPERLLAAAARGRPARRPLARAAVWAVAGLAAGLLGGSLIGDWVASLHPADAEEPIARQAAIVHATYSPEVRHAVEVGADQEAHLSAWLSKRLGHAVKAPDLHEQGFALVGGRLLPGERVGGADALPPPTAHFLYQCNMGRRVTLYVRPESASHQQSAFRFARQANVNTIYWSDRDLGYALSSVEVGREELQRIADVAYRQLNP
jgi:anti-sigma factor RsiW